ncbi:MAG: pyridoxamine 5'-phosphate oxidase [Microcystaceae cyanobacterium]
MNLSISDLRENYTQSGLLESDALSDPFAQFRRWFEEAVSANLLEPNAMTLATVTPEGRPMARVVLLKGFDTRGFVFYTNYDSAKGKQLTATPWASLVFWWGKLERQVRIEGKVEKVASQESDDYFHSRPLASQLGAWASPQSKVIESRDVLEKELEQLKSEYKDKSPNRPENWGGFRVIPHQIEFWQGRPSRLHDRLCYYQQPDGSWQRQRLAP